ncbi:oxidative stress survival, Svf1-like protein [Piedraia hortae CBS 480.64]|uniref:Oxidative stress survival, Svf1-like protein n=1 Tax=Piedraia hortae CBS 480.64 TaxID=1314780 RepID=A0A6A7BVX1_9PEZI|nr:oxidative stress survival, Svf1-like protein [Piedraia hortae CBS 480.64]
MLSWAKSAVGLTEPIYGESAVQPVSTQAQSQPYTILTRDDLAWTCMDGTNVETKTFYIFSDAPNKIGLVQIIYSNVMGIRTTAQFNLKIFNQEGDGKHLWVSDNLSDFSFSQDKQTFTSKQGVELALSPDGEMYSFRAKSSNGVKVDLSFKRAAEGFMVGKDGTTYFGTDPKKPWGRMTHLFWPVCAVEGSVTTANAEVVDIKGRGVFIHALQGMKPHFAAAKWNFGIVNSQRYTAVMMEFTTPLSYGSTTVTVGGIADAKEGRLITASASPSVSVKHVQTHQDARSDWPEPTDILFQWKGETADGKGVTAKAEGPLGTRVDRVDVMGELPKFVKQIAASASGARPYIYQYTPKIELEVDVWGEKVEEEGQLFMEATFIT